MCAASCQTREVGRSLNVCKYLVFFLPSHFLIDFAFYVFLFFFLFFFLIFESTMRVTISDGMLNPMFVCFSWSHQVTRHGNTVKVGHHAAKQPAASASAGTATAHATPYNPAYYGGPTGYVEFGCKMNLAVCHSILCCCICCVFARGQVDMWIHDACVLYFCFSVFSYGGPMGPMMAMGVPYGNPGGPSIAAGPGMCRFKFILPPKSLDVVSEKTSCW
jgi:hypothetical protein